MNCARLRQVLDAYTDGELDSATGREMEKHLEECLACASLRRERAALHEGIRRSGLHRSAPRSLARAIRSSVRAQSKPVNRLRRWLLAGGLAMTAGAVGLAVGLWLGNTPFSNDLDEVAANHVAALSADSRLVDVRSGDRHTIKPWFVGRVDFAPLVRDVSSEGFELVGARLDHLAGTKAAVTVYRVRNHTINLFAWRVARPREEALRLETIRGFACASWASGGLRFAAISDVDPDELRRFVEAVSS